MYDGFAGEAQVDGVFVQISYEPLPALTRTWFWPSARFAPSQTAR
jgi:hypothetical protein